MRLYQFYLWLRYRSGRNRAGLAESTSLDRIWGYTRSLRPQIGESCRAVADGAANYQSFLREWPNGGEWPQWVPQEKRRVLPPYDIGHGIDLAAVALPLVASAASFLRPAIVGTLVNANDSDEFRTWARDREVHTWNGCSVSFPGWTRDQDADGNSLPKQLWAFCLLGFQYRSRGVPPLPSPAWFCHILRGDPDYVQDGLTEILQKDDGVEWPSEEVLFTSPSNGIFLPKFLSSLTDHPSLITWALLEHAISLYGHDAVLPPGVNLVPDLYDTAGLDWNDPVGTDDLLCVEDFLEFRRHWMNEHA